jgi:hypothetical protein
MTEITVAERGSIWTVPTLGQDALALIISGTRGVSRGRPEYQIVPLYLPSLFSEHTNDDVVIEANETNLGIQYYAALWNARPVLFRDLGHQVGIVVSRSMLDDLRDAYLRKADASIKVRKGRLGKAAVSEAVRALRSAEIKVWQPLSGRVFAPQFDQTVDVLLSAQQNWTEWSASEVRFFTERIVGCDELLEQQTAAMGPDRADILFTEVALIAGVALASFFAPKAASAMITTSSIDSVILDDAGRQATLDTREHQVLNNDLATAA